MNLYEVLFNVLFIVLATAVLIRTFHEWQQYEHPIMKRAIWLLLVPSYSTLLMGTIVALMIQSSSQHLFLSILKTFSSIVFIYTGILFGILLFILQRKKEKILKNRFTHHGRGIHEH